MCSKFHLDILETVGGVGDTIFHQQTNQSPACPSADSNLPLPPISLLSWGYNDGHVVCVIEVSLYQLFCTYNSK